MVLQLSSQNLALVNSRVEKSEATALAAQPLFSITKPPLTMRATANYTPMCRDVEEQLHHHPPPHTSSSANAAHTASALNTVSFHNMKV